MNSNYGRSTQSGFDFDLRLNSNNSRSLSDQKNKTTSSYSSPSSTFSRPNSTSSWQPNKPSWTHQPSAPSQSTLHGSLNGPSSMVGDIMGKSWASSAPSSNSSSVIGIVNKNPNLFSDLVGPALGQNKGSGNVALKNVMPASSKNAYSMGSMADSLPKAGNSGNSSGNWGSSGSFSSYNTNNASLSKNKSPNLGGQSMRSSAGSGVGGGLKSNNDPFGSFVDFGSKPAAGMNSGSIGNANKTDSGDDGFGDFQNSSKSSGLAFSPSGFPANISTSMGPSKDSYSTMDDFGMPTTQKQSSGFYDFDVLFANSSASSGATAKGSETLGSQQFSEADDWGMESEFGGGNDMSVTTELEGLPPPPGGVTASAAKNKGMDNYKQGQYPDAIKWLSWSLILFQKAGDNGGIMEVLSSRASCYKEVGEYKKAVTDCTKVLEHDDTNVSILVQRALLYESMEKYKLGAEDLRTVMKLDPSNRVARSTVHRLTKLAE